MRKTKALRRNRMHNATTRPLFVGIPDAVLSRIVSLVHELLVRDERNADEFADEDEYYWEYVKDEEYVRRVRRIEARRASPPPRMAPLPSRTAAASHAAAWMSCSSLKRSQRGQGCAAR